jgi:hypothetical protein
MPLDPDAFADVVIETIGMAIVPVLERQAATERQVNTLIAQRDRVVDDLSALRERLAVLETRAPVPGPPGPPGRDGSDGVGFDDLAIEQIDNTTVTIKAVRGDVVKVIGTVRFPAATFERDYEPGREYVPGNIVRHKRAIWHCMNATTMAPGTSHYDDAGKLSGPQGWSLLLRDGTNGKDGKDGPPGPQGKQGRDWQQVYDDARRR